jgi:ribosomal protein L37AE/L43A
MCISEFFAAFFGLLAGLLLVRLAIKHHFVAKGYCPSCGTKTVEHYEQGGWSGEYACPNPSCPDKKGR